MAPELSLPPEFLVTTASLNGSIVISVCGELDVMTAPQLEDALVACNGQPMVVDLTGLTFIDSSGLHVLMRKRPDGKRAAVVVAPESHVARVFDIAGADEIIVVCTDLQAAMDASGQAA